MHNFKLRAAAKEITEALVTLDADALEAAKEQLWNDTPSVISSLFDGIDGLFLNLTGVDWKIEEGESPLTIQIYDVNESAVLHAYNPITTITDDPPAKENIPSIQRAISALQSGIDRLRAYEAECIKAQR